MHPDPDISPARLAELARLTHHRWMIPVLGACDRAPGGGLKHVTFLHRLGLGRDSLGRTLAAAIDAGWLMHNPGAGHPLRPEYVLTPRGRALAPHCRRTLAALRRLGCLELGLNKWSLAVLAAVAAGAGRFSHMARLLGDATPRALATALRDLAAAGVLLRQVQDTYPPGVQYVPARRAARLAASARALARHVGSGTPRSFRPLNAPPGRVRPRRAA